MDQQRLVRYLSDLDIVLVETHGSYILGAEIETLKKTVKLSQEYSCKKLLFDHRKANVIAETMEGYDRPSVYAGIGLHRLTKLATLVREVDDNLKFYETVCVNRGWSMKVFDDYDAAVAWLMER